MRYEVQPVEVGDLPAGVDMVIVERCGHPAVMLVAGRPAQVWAAMRQWEDSLDPTGVPSLLYAV